MKSVSLTLMVAVIVVTSCSDAQVPAGRFFDAFSLDETIKRLNMPELQLASGGASFSSSPGDPTPYRKSVALEFRIEDRPGSRFDEQSFLQKLKTAIEQEARNSNVDLEEGGSVGGESFYVTYQDGGNQGALEVIGVRVENDRYKIWCIVRELSVPRRD
jgi:hypothetical protein